MPVLPAAALAHLTAVAEAAMDDTCEVLRRALAGRGPSGGLDVGYAVHATVACRIAPGWQPPQERSYGGGIAAITAAMLHVPLGTDVRATDRIHVLTGNEAGATWEVTNTFKRRSEEVQLTVLCSELGGLARVSDARDLFEPEPTPPALGAAVLGELALMRLTLEAIRTDLEAIRQEIEAFAQAPPPHATVSVDDALPPGGGAPLAAGGRASYPGFPPWLRGRGW